MSSKNTKTTKIKAILERKGISQIELCAKIQKNFKPVRTDAISQIVTGKKANITIFTLVKICSALKVSPNDIIDYEQIEAKLKQEKKALSAQQPTPKVPVKQNKKSAMKKNSQPSTSTKPGVKKEDIKSSPMHQSVDTVNRPSQPAPSRITSRIKLVSPIPGRNKK